MESLSLLMPPIVDQLFQDQEEDKITTTMMFNDPQNIVYSEPKRNRRMLFWKSLLLLLFIFLSMIGYGIIIYFSHHNRIGIDQLKDQIQQLQKTSIVLKVN